MRNFLRDITTAMLANDTDTAYATTQAWLQQEPQADEALHILGILNAQQGNFAQAISNFEQAILLAPHEAVYYNNLSNAWKKFGDFDKAISHLQQALRLMPNYAEAYNNLACIYYTQGRINEAIAVLKKALRLKPDHWEIHFNLANCLIKQDRVLQAISHYQQALQYYPTAPANFKLAKTNYNNKHNYINNSSSANNHGADPRLIAIKQNLGMAYVVNKQYHAALPLLEQAAQYDRQLAESNSSLPTTAKLPVQPNAELQAQLAEVYLELGQVNQAIAQFNYALSLTASRAEWQHNLAVLYLRNNEKQLALQHFTRALQLQPDNDIARHMILALSGTSSNQAPPDYVASLFDQYAQFYNQHVTKTLHYKAPELLRSIVAKHINLTRTLNILDIGCGTGLCAVYFKDIAKFLVGIDLSNNMLTYAKSLTAYDGLCQGNIFTCLPGAQQNFFDLLLAADVLVYCGALDQIFANCYATLKSGGHFAFTIETIDDLSAEPLTQPTPPQFEQNNGYILTNTGRYAHSKQYILALADKYDFTFGAYQPCILRNQQDTKIHGAVILLAKK